MDPSGWMRTGWVLVGDTWYYMYPSGMMAYRLGIGRRYMVLPDTGERSDGDWMAPAWKYLVLSDAGQRRDGHGNTGDRRCGIYIFQ